MFEPKRAKRTSADLKAKFEALGAPDVDFQISVEQEDGNPRLAPLVLFHNVWKAVLRKGDTQWLEQTIKHFEMRKQLTGVAAAKWPQDDTFLNSLKTLVDSGIDLAHVTAVARQAQQHLLYHFAYVLSDSTSDEEVFKDVGWAVFETDADGKPLRPMNELQALAGIVEPAA
jgi:hypothetical protein